MYDYYCRYRLAAGVRRERLRKSVESTRRHAGIQGKSVDGGTHTVGRGGLQVLALVVGQRKYLQLLEKMNGNHRTVRVSEKKTPQQSARTFYVIVIIERTIVNSDVAEKKIWIRKNIYVKFMWEWTTPHPKKKS